MSTTPRESWTFTATPDKIDLVRVIRELNAVGAKLALLHIEGKTYTAWRHDHPRAGEITARLMVWASDPGGIQAAQPPAVSMNAKGEPLIETIYTPCPGVYPEDGDWYLRVGDHTALFAERLTVVVEVIQ